MQPQTWQFREDGSRARNERLEQRETFDRFGPTFTEGGSQQGRFVPAGQPGERGHVSGDESSIKYGERDSGFYYSHKQPPIVPGRPQFIGKGPKGYVRSDERIREAICERLSEGHLDASDIEVTVKDGEVTLSGTVNDRRTRRQAEELLDSISGIKDVDNQLKPKASW